jgi:hypothetical protein
MSLFNGVTEGAARKPDVVINGSGRFPDIQSAGIRGISGKINQGSSFFDSVTPYGPLSVSDDINYRTRPIKCQKVCPEIMLPGTDGTQIKLSHAVASGDLCFTLRLSKAGKSQVINNYNFFDKINLTPALDCLVGLPCVNYLLAGLCHFRLEDGTQKKEVVDTWVRFLGSVIGSYEEAKRLMTMKDNEIQETFRKTELILLVIKEYIKPFGFCIGSDWQGGQTQGSAEPNIGPVSYVTVVQIEGLAENIVNIWAKAGNTVNCGDDLTLAMVPHLVDNKENYYKDQYTTDFERVFQAMPRKETYVLNHWQYNTVKQVITFDKDEIVYELLPLTSSTIQKGVFPSWHICRTQLMAKAHTPGLTCYRNDILMQKTGALLEVTIAPVFEYAYITDVLYRLKRGLSTGTTIEQWRNDPQGTLNSVREPAAAAAAPAAAPAVGPAAAARMGVVAANFGAPATSMQQNDTFQMESIFTEKPTKRQKKSVKIASAVEDFVEI